MVMLQSDGVVERVLRWATVELGTAELSDRYGAGMLVPEAPAWFRPAEAAVAGPVLLLRRERWAGEGPQPSSFAVLRDSVRPGAAVLVSCDPSIGAAFGSNIALQAAALRAQCLVTDGAWRDGGRLPSVGLVVGSNGGDPRRPAGCPFVVCERADLFGVTWVAGDWFLRDVDGLARLSREQAVEIASEIAAGSQDEVAALVEGAP
jgi:Aldolase/RraA